mmetsp:Transcript_9159/g.18338  ORF Transcript_9159/g.18338 Transcript_9159/m.18338 type:complete len:590 (-) Transcript_9159:29-1798(-)|eukprot:CAMPEP_0182464510 /NCGR_PEP_ID=MMETSP1319-20130603/8683_1 /TAXON_ID=172717 /ORGANISM="Bolidomonas pacifica, Strain RCC208" /LENGTH=589 /DNA_ID=CAMNT_0024664157 /DNA_START=246 /DNA_END=2015 /DNA_ORIENTATION=+
MIIRIAYYPDPVKSRTPGYPKQDVANVLKLDPTLSLRRIDNLDDLSTDNYDVVLFPGGFAPNTLEELGDDGEAKIKAFVNAGGGFVGICAGAYLGSNWGWGLIDAELPYINRWARGKTDSCILDLKNVTPSGAEFNARKKIICRYANGPLLVCGTGVQPLATFMSELRGKKNKYPSEMSGTAAIAMGKCGKGTVVLQSPHLESSSDVYVQSLFLGMFRCAAGLTETTSTLTPETTTPETREILETSTPGPGDCACMEAVIDDKEAMPPASNKLPLTNCLVCLESDGYSVAGQPHVTSVNAALPIVFTAPHGLQVYRQYESGKRGLHFRERWSTEIAVKLAVAAGKRKAAALPSSFVVWNYKTAKRKDPNNLDPNYLLDDEQTISPFSSGLKHFRRLPGPRFHVDVHGKKDRKHNLNLDVGLEPMHAEWPIKDQTKGLSATVGQAFETFFKGRKTETFRSRAQGASGRMPFGVETSPRLHGYWGEDTVKTVSHQSVLDGMPALQLEIPYTMRSKLVSDDEFFAGWSEALLSAIDAWLQTVGEDAGAVEAEEQDKSTAMGCPVRLDEATCLAMLDDLKAMDLRQIGREKMI